MRDGDGPARGERADGAARRRGRHPRPDELDDLYDLVGHDLAGIALQSELAEALVPAAPEQAAAAMREVGQVARTALRAVRAAVAPDRPATLASALRGARELVAAAGMAYRQEGEPVCVQEGEPLPQPAAIEAALSSAIREGVANVVRHSRAHLCIVRVRQEGDEVGVEVLDDGVGTPDSAAGGPVAAPTPQRGDGLRRLTARVAALGGQCAAGPRPDGGFRLAVTLPLPTDRAGPPLAPAAHRSPGTMEREGARAQPGA